MLVDWAKIIKNIEFQVFGIGDVNWNHSNVKIKIKNKSYLNIELYRRCKLKKF